MTCPAPATFWGPGCSIDFQITNVGAGPVQIPSAGFQLNGTPQQNSEQYNLVDRCSFTSPPLEPCYPQLGGGPAACQLYDAQVELSTAVAGTLFTDSPSSKAENGPCPTLTIAPGATIELYMDGASHAALVYSVTPVLTVDTQGGHYLVSIPEAAGTMAFGDPSQFACYKLQQGALMKALTGADVFPTTDPASGTANNFETWAKAGVWCL